MATVYRKGHILTSKRLPNLNADMAFSAHPTGKGVSQLKTLGWDGAEVV